MRMDVLLVGWAEGPRPEVAEEPTDEVERLREAPGHDADLQFTQRRDVGRYSMRAGSISRPHRSQMP